MNSSPAKHMPANHQGSGRITCPLCGGTVSRIPRRMIDRIASLLRPVQRFRCRSFICQWVGNIPTGPMAADPTDRTPL